MINRVLSPIQKELGEIGDEGNDLDSLMKKIESTGLPPEANEKVLSEYNKLKMMSPMSAEATVVRNYLDWMVDIPWFKKTQLDIEIKKATIIPIKIKLVALCFQKAQCPCLKYIL